MQIACMLDVQGASGLDVLSRFLAENSDDDLVRKLASKWARGLWENKEVCDSMISIAAVKWDLSRLNQAHRGILRLGTYQ